MRWYKFGWFYGIVLCSVAEPSNNTPDAFPRTYRVYGALYDILLCVVIVCFGLVWLCVLGYIFSPSLFFNSISPNAVFWRPLVDAHVARSMGVVLSMPSSSILTVCGGSDTTRNGPSARASSLLHVAFAIAFAECVDAAKIDSRSTSTMPPGLNVGMTCTSLS